MVGGRGPPRGTNTIMRRDKHDRLGERVIRSAESALADHKYVSAIEMFSRLGWLPASRYTEWRQGRLPYLEAGVTASLPKISAAMKIMRAWARQRGLKPSETGYVSRTRDRRPLRFSKSGDPDIERAYRTHWVSPELSENKRKKLSERLSKPPDLVVISPLHEWSCAVCSGSGDLLIMEERGPVCLRCAGMDHLVYLPRGDATLTRRAKEASSLSAVVVRFSRTRKRYERQGILIEGAALEHAMGSIP